MDFIILMLDQLVSFIIIVRRCCAYESCLIGTGNRGFCTRGKDTNPIYILTCRIV